MSDENKNLPESKQPASENDIFSRAKTQLQLQRHKSIDSALDSSLEVVQGVLDSDADDSLKLYVVNIAIGIYKAKETFEREDVKLALDYERLKLDREKFEVEKKKLSVPGGPLCIINQQNNINLSSDHSDKSAKKRLQSRKEKAAKLLEDVSGIPQNVLEEDITKK